MTEVHLEIDDHVAVLSIDGPRTRNSLDVPAAREIVRYCDEIDANLDVGAVVLRAEGPSFCSGANRELLASVGKDPTDSSAFNDLGSIYQAFVRVGRLEPPTVAAVTGDAVGAGLNLVLATDIRIIAAEATLLSGFARIGLHPGGGHFALLGRLVGRERAAMIGLFGEVLDGQKAADIGLAAEVHQRDDVLPRCLELARAAAADPALARATARSMRAELGPPALSWDVALDVERAPQMWSMRRAQQQAR